MVETMSMAAYTAEIRHAVESLLPLIWDEHAAVLQQKEELDSLTRKVERQYQQADSLTSNAEDHDDFMLGVGRQWETYWGPDKDRHHLDSRVAEAEAAAATRKFSVNALSAALLQYGKQSLSIVHG